MRRGRHDVLIYLSGRRGNCFLHLPFLPWLSLANTSAPSNIKASATASFPCLTERWRAVCPSLAAWFTEAPWLSRHSATGACPLRQAASKGVSPSGLTQFTSDKEVNPPINAQTHKYNGTLASIRKTSFTPHRSVSLAALCKQHI